MTSTAHEDQFLPHPDDVAQAQPKRRPYNASASLSEYGVFPECDAAPAAEDSEKGAGGDPTDLGHDVDTYDFHKNASTAELAAWQRGWDDCREADRQQRGGDHFRDATKMVSTEDLHVTHRPLIREAVGLLRLRQPATPDFERVASELESALDGLPTPAGAPSQEWLKVDALAPQPAASAEPSKDDVVALYHAAMTETSGGFAEAVNHFARALLSRYGRPAGDAQPVADHKFYPHPGYRAFCQKCGKAEADHPTAPVAAQKADDARDAERYRFIRDTPWLGTELERVIGLQKNGLWDAAIDAAIAQQRKERQP